MTQLVGDARSVVERDPQKHDDSDAVGELMRVTVSAGGSLMSYGLH
jgi:hypothetical protein